MILSHTISTVISLFVIAATVTIMSEVRSPFDRRIALIIEIEQENRPFRLLGWHVIYPRYPEDLIRYEYDDDNNYWDVVYVWFDFIPEHRTGNE